METTRTHREFRDRKRIERTKLQGGGMPTVSKRNRPILPIRDTKIRQLQQFMSSLVTYLDGKSLGIPSLLRLDVQMVQ